MLEVYGVLLTHQGTANLSPLAVPNLVASDTGRLPPPARVIDVPAVELSSSILRIERGPTQKLANTIRVLSAESTEPLCWDWEWYLHRRFNCWASSGSQSSINIRTNSARLSPPASSYSSACDSSRSRSWPILNINDFAKVCVRINRQATSELFPNSLFYSCP